MSAPTEPSGIAAALRLDEPARRSDAVELSASMSHAAAFSVVAAECVDHWRSNEAELRLSRAAPHLHQTRVGLRRLRSAVSLFRRSLGSTPADDVRRCAHELRALALPFGHARDLDVLLMGPLVDDLDEVQAAGLLADREAAYDVVLAVLRSSSWAGACGRLDDVLAALARVGAPLPLVIEAAPAALDLRLRRVVRSSGHLSSMEAAARHRVRIEAKKLRYGCEFFTSLFPAGEPRVSTGSGEVLVGMPAFATAVEDVQSALGALNDHATADALLRRVGSHAPAVHEADPLSAAETAVAHLTDLPVPWHR
ncbi:CHAD domain-containing protein [Oryzobacter sp. R7]|uniref:CHAD domain-containing protein n=1 Tax=Oryzobacter faecalis TaxID=3388656 RepID=UPI00398D2523